MHTIRAQKTDLIYEIVNMIRLALDKDVIAKPDSDTMKDSVKEKCYSLR